MKVTSGVRLFLLQLGSRCLTMRSEWAAARPTPVDTAHLDLGSSGGWTHIPPGPGSRFPSRLACTTKVVWAGEGLPWVPPGQDPLVTATGIELQVRRATGGGGGRCKGYNFHR